MINRKTELNLFASEGKLTEEALSHCRITGVDPKEIEPR